MRVLFISHGATRTGGPLFLLTFLSWLKANTSISFDVLILEDGPLKPRFEQLARTFCVAKAPRASRSIPDRLRRKLLGSKNVAGIAYWAGLLGLRRYALVYGNSVVCLDWTRAIAASARSKAVCHIHEMSWMIDRFFPREHVARALPGMNLVVACSAAAAVDLQATFAVPPSLIRVIPSFVGDIQIEVPREILRKSLGVSHGTCLVGGAGTPELRKGVDLLAPLAAALKYQHPTLDFKIIWLGVTEESEALTSLCRRDAERLGVEDVICYLEQTPSADDYINALDVVIVPSRIEPLSLVALAASALRRPIVAFEGAGGINEIIADGAGVPVPYLSVGAMAFAIARLAEDPQLASKVCDRAESRFRTGYTCEVLAPALHSAIVDVVDGNRSQ